MVIGVCPVQYNSLPPPVYEWRSNMSNNFPHNDSFSKIYLGSQNAFFLCKYCLLEYSLLEKHFKMPFYERTKIIHEHKPEYVGKM